MTRRAYRPFVMPFALAALMPASALAAAGAAPGSGGAGMSGSGSGSGSAGGAALTQPADTTVSASGNGITVQTVATGLLSRHLRFTGSAPSSDAGQTVVIERSPTGTPGSWVATAKAVVQSNGSFTAAWKATQSGQLAIEAVVVSPSASAADARSHQAAPSPSTAPSGPSTSPLTITVYRPAIATFYGPGFYGHRTACGQRLRRATIGVASRTLKCGTKVSIIYFGREITVPVIDRGPFANHASWDLTMATAEALGITETSRIGALPTR